LAALGSGGLTWTSKPEQFNGDQPLYRTDAEWMYNRAQDLGIPFMAGSSVPLFWRNPWLEHPLECPIREALFLSFGSLEGYGYHGFETLQSFVERRIGGETGLAAVTMLEGEQVWAAAREGRWSSKLLDYAIAQGQRTLVGNRKYTEPTYAVAPGRPEDFDFTSGTVTPDNPRGMKSDPSGGTEGPYCFLYEYSDGFRAAQLHMTAYVRDWIYAADVEGEGMVCTVLSSSEANPNPSFSYLGAQRNHDSEFISVLFIECWMVLSGHSSTLSLLPLPAFPSFFLMCRSKHSEAVRRQSTGVPCRAHATRDRRTGRLDGVVSTPSKIVHSI
jgi:hypothetical protein